MLGTTNRIEDAPIAIVLEPRNIATVDGQRLRLGPVSRSLSLSGHQLDQQPASGGRPRGIEHVDQLADLQSRCGTRVGRRGRDQREKRLPGGCGRWTRRRCRLGGRSGRRPWRREPTSPLGPVPLHPVADGAPLIGCQTLPRFCTPVVILFESVLVEVVRVVQVHRLGVQPDIRRYSKDARLVCRENGGPDVLARDRTNPRSRGTCTSPRRGRPRATALHRYGWVPRTTAEKLVGFESVTDTRPSRKYRLTTLARRRTDELTKRSGQGPRHDRGSRLYKPILSSTRLPLPPPLWHELEYRAQTRDPDGLCRCDRDMTYGETERERHELTEQDFNTDGDRSQSAGRNQKQLVNPSCSS